MTSTVALTTTEPVDVRLDAFSQPEGPEVFGSATQLNQVWLPDPFDVPTIHQEARETFDWLVRRATTKPLPTTGKTLLLLGEAGSGKTHLMRAFRNRVHADGAGYCAYMQMTTRQDSYSRYILSSILDALSHPYCQLSQTSGLVRFATGLLDALTNASDEQKRSLREDELDPADLAKLVHFLADEAVKDARFQLIDLDLLRAVLYLLSPDARIRSRVSKWLRCEDLARADRAMLGDLVPRPQDYALNTIVALGRLMSAIHDAALVVCADQIEEMLEQNAKDGDTAGVFRRMIETLIAVNEAIPNSVVVISCLEDYYKVAQSQLQLQKPKLDRLEHDPKPIRLHTNRTSAEIHSIVSLRLGYFFEAFDLSVDPERPTFPLTDGFLNSLVGMSTREVLNHCREQREKCIRGEKMDGVAEISTTRIEHDRHADLISLWNDFHSAFDSPVMDDESTSATLLAWAIENASSEMADGIHYGTDRDDRFIPVEIHGPANTVDKILVAICDRSARGGGLGKQVDEVAKRAGELPAVFVRSNPYPPSANAAVSKRLTQLIVPKGKGRRVEVQSADWRIMAAFRAFQEQHGKSPEFIGWQRAQRPMTNLASVREILSLDKSASPAMLLPHAIAPMPDSMNSKAPSRPVSKPIPVESGPMLLGRTRTASLDLVYVSAIELRQQAAFLGGPGSGKTTAALVLIEQLLMRGIPAVLIDRKGDLARYADPDAWTQPDADSGRQESRNRLRDRLDVALFTPGSENGRPLTLPIVPSDFAQMPASDRQQLAGYATAALGGMMGYRVNGMDPRSAILSKAIEVLGLQSGRQVTVHALYQIVEEQDESLLAAVGSFDDKHYRKLAENLLTLYLQRQSLLEGKGESLDFDAILNRGPNANADKTRLAIINTQFLGTALDFWLAQFLSATARWASRNPAEDGQIQAVFLFDEADQYLPANRQPATKGPMENLLKRCRSTGLSLFLATQSPGDFDYKCRDQIRLWLIGRISQSTAIDKVKPMLESARIDPSSKLPGQSAGQFYLAREREVLPIQAERSLIATQQLSEDRILQIASAQRSSASA